jgi:hypothetical protein
MEPKGSFYKRCRADNERKITCPVGGHHVPQYKFLTSMGMCTDCYEVYAMDMENLADERDEARSAHEEYIMAH